MSLSSRFFKRLHYWEFLFVFAVTLVMICLYFLVVPFIELVELKAWDLHFARRGAREPSGMVTFVTIDEQSVNREGRWPWPRRLMARLLRSIEAHGARVIGLDLGFFEPDLKLRQQALLDVRDRLRGELSGSPLNDLAAQLEEIAQHEDDDLILADTLKSLSVPLVLGHFFYMEKNVFLPPPPPPEALEKAACPIVQLMSEPLEGKLNEATGLEINIPDLREASPRSGSFNVLPDPDGSIRWMPLVIRYQKRFFPSFTIQMLSAVFPELPLIVKADERGIMDIRLGPVSIPTNNKGEILVNYYGPPYSFPHISATALMRGELPPDCLRDKLVVLGNTTEGLHDIRPTPFSAVFPGVEVHCTVLENILRQDFLRRSERTAPLYDMSAIVAMALLFLLAHFFLRGIPLAGATVILLGGYVWLTHFAFLKGGLWLNHIYPSVNLAVAYLGTTVHRYLKEAREKRVIRQTFSLYVPRSVVEEMLAYPERLRLGGEKKDLTVLFSDIRGFTTLSEQLPAEELVPQLNEYLTRMTEVVFEHHGTLDKYIGDAIMAIFGAPLPQEDHACRACATALAMMRSLESLQGLWRERGQPVFQVGIGINTGLMMVGNMGSERRFDYTALGDNVNLASRLEGLTKMYGVGLVVSESTWEQAKDRFIGRELDVVRVKGKQKPVAIFQVMDVKEKTASYLEPLELYRKAMEKYRQGLWAEAIALFQQVENWWPADPPSRLYIDRCRELLDHPPETDWSFVTVLDHK